MTVFVETLSVLVGFAVLLTLARPRTDAANRPSPRPERTTAAPSSPRPPAPKGDPSAPYIVAQRYLTGDGICANPHAALRWFGVAAQLGHPEASYFYARLLADLSDAPSARAQALDVLVPAVPKLKGTPFEASAQALLRDLRTDHLPYQCSRRSTRSSRTRSSPRQHPTPTSTTASTRIPGSTHDTSRP